MNSTDRYKILMNIISQQGLDADLYTELAKAEKMINMIDQRKMMPPPIPEEPTQEPIEPPTEQPITGKYDNI
jgi:hypothetical protein